MNTYISLDLAETAPAKVTAAGDMVYATAANALARLGIGAAGTVLTSTGSAPSWGVGAGVTKIQEYVLASNLAAPFVFSSIPATYRNLEIWVTSRLAEAVGLAGANLNFNGDTGSNYAYQGLYSSFSTTVTAYAIATSTKLQWTAVGSAVASRPSSLRIFIPNYAGSFYKDVQIVNTYSRADAAASDWEQDYIHGLWRSTAAITSISIDSTGTYLAGSVATLYGWA